MGRTNYYARGTGFTEAEALQDAINHDREYNGHQEGYSGTIGSRTGENDTSKCVKKPKIAKRCIVKKNVCKGARKWVTVYDIKPIFGSVKQETARVKTTQGDAVKKAKELALKNQTAYQIFIKKELENSQSEIAYIEPAKSEKGEWVFEGIARE